MYKFLTSQFVVCIICNYCGLNGQMSACIVLQQAMVLIDKGYINYQLNYNTPQASDSLQLSPDGNRKRFQMSDFAPGHLRHIHKSHLLAMNISNLTRCDINSGVWHKADENSTLLGNYAVSSGNSLVTFTYLLFIYFSMVQYKVFKPYGHRNGHIIYTHSTNDCKIQFKSVD